MMVKLLLALLMTRKVVENTVLKAMRPQKLEVGKSSVKAGMMMLMSMRAMRARNDAAYFTKMAM